MIIKGNIIIIIIIIITKPTFRYTVGRSCRQSSVSVGLGVNRVLVLVVDSSETSGVDVDERRVLNVYTLTVYRQTRYTVTAASSSTITAVDPSSSFAADTPTQACSLLQVVSDFLS